MVIKKTVSPQMPPVHPGLVQKLREAEEAEQKGVTPRSAPAAQRVLRPSLEVSSRDRALQARTIGLVDPSYREGVDGRVAIAEQAAFRAGEDLDAIWDELSEADKVRAGAIERFRLEMDTCLERARRSLLVPHQIAGRLDARNLRRSEENLCADLDAMGELIAPDSYELIRRFLRETREVLETCMRQRALLGLDAPALYDVLRDLFHKLVYQELASRRRAMGDRGVRHIIGLVDLSEMLLAQWKRLPDYSPRERLLARIIHVHQDLGHTAYAARVSFRGARLHRAYSARILSDDLNRYRVLLTQEEIDLALNAVATHSSEELPFTSSRLLAVVRAVDHLAPFAPHRVYKHLETIPGVTDFLDDLVVRAQSGAIDAYLGAKEALARFLCDSDLPRPLCEDLVAAFRPLERQAEFIDIGALAGQVEKLELDMEGAGSARAVLAPDPFARRYQGLFDHQQEQLVRLARNTGITMEQLRQSRALRFVKADFGALVIEHGGAEGQAGS